MTFCSVNFVKRQHSLHDLFIGWPIIGRSLVAYRLVVVVVVVKRKLILRKFLSTCL